MKNPIDIQDYMQWPQEKIDALFEEMFGNDYTKLADFAKEVDAEIAIRDMQTANE